MFTFQLFRKKCFLNKISSVIRINSSLEFLNYKRVTAIILFFYVLLVLYLYKNVFYYSYYQWVYNL